MLRLAKLSRPRNTMVRSTDQAAPDLQGIPKRDLLAALVRRRPRVGD